MINVHLNGEIVRCPDSAAVQKRANEIRDLHRLCKYNYHENNCPVWLMAVRTHKFSGRCPLAGSNDCPGRKRQLEFGKKQKTYKIDGKKYRQISSAAHYMLKTQRKKIIFFTLSLPPFKRETNENEINQAFSKFMENLHSTYGVKHYIAVRENGDTNGRAHFHILCDIKFVSFTILNNAWNHTIQDFCDYSLCAFRTEKKNVILRNPQTALRYICKYVSKARGKISNSRTVFMSLPLIIKHRRVNNEIRDMLETYKSVKVLRTSDWTVCYRITDYREFEQFCNLYLYELFDLPNNPVNFTGMALSEN